MKDEQLRANIARYIACGNMIKLDDLARRISRQSGEELKGHKLVEKVIEFFPDVPIGREGLHWEHKFVIKERMPTCKHARCLQKKIEAAHLL